MKIIKKISVRLITTLMLVSLFYVANAQNQKTAQEQTKDTRNQGKYNPYEVLDTRIDNMGYWRKAAELGLAPVAPQINVPEGKFKSSMLRAKSVVREDSPDVPVTQQNSTQSESSIFVDPNDPDHVLQSNNSTTNPVSTLFGANYFFSEDFGQTWGGSLQGAGGSNSGDPSVAIGLNGRQYVGFISASGGMGVSYSDNGTTWTQVTASASSNLDKNHLTIDNSPKSAYEGYVYNAWVAFGGSNMNEIEFVRSTNNGESYSTPINISSNVNATSHNQGVNLQTGPNGEVYAIWTIYDGWPSDEDAIGFARSYNGGMSFQPAERIIDNIRGIRHSETSKNQRVNSFPVMAVDISDSPNSGNIYVVWTNIGTPGINTGGDMDIYMIISEDDGTSWSNPIRINQDATGLGNEHYFPWITCDPTNGVLSVIFYDDRNVGGNKCEVFCANSADGGTTWEDFRVSDVDFTPSPIPGLAGDYMGDYLGISARAGKVYPVWCDNRNGSVMTYTSPYEVNPLQMPENLSAEITFETGEVNLSWQFETVPGFQYFIIYRDDFEIGTTTDDTFLDVLPIYGVYNYMVTAFHDDGESFGPSIVVQWGDGHIAVDPEQIIEYIEPDATSSHYITIENTGELDLIYEAFSYTEPLDGVRDYCTPTADCSQGDGLTGFAIADINNLNNGCSPNGFGDFTTMSTVIEPEATYEVTMSTGYSNQYVTIWIDFDKSGEFDPDEMILQDYNLPSSGTFTTDVTMPLVISGWMYMARLVDTLAPGDSQIAQVLFDATDLPEGAYYGNIFVESNDPDMPLLDIPVTLNVGDMLPLALQVIATATTICNGESTELQALPSGGSGVYTYQWTSDPAGFNSTDPQPVVYPEGNTTYYVDVNDGLNTIAGQVSVVVNQLPEIPVTPIGDNSLCWGEYQTVYSTDGSMGANTYNWSLEPEDAGNITGTGLTATVTWNEEFIGTAQVSVLGINDCGEGDMSDVLEIIMNELPTVDLGEDISVCANEVIILDAGNPDAEYLWSTGETTQTIEVDTTGVGIGSTDIWVQVMDVVSCANSDTITIYFDDCTGVYELADQWSVQIFPNPSNGQFSVNLQSATDSHVSLSIYNSIGREVYRNDKIRVETNSDINIHLNHPDGIYFLNLKGDGVNLIKKVVIQK
nr:T9SS type A sorting domain-containing protein [Bacteroidota bacterium]